MTILPPRPGIGLPAAAAFRVITDRLREAQIADVVMRGPMTEATARDIATDSYVTAVDAMFEHLSALAEAGVLARLQAVLDAEADHG